MFAIDPTRLDLAREFKRSPFGPHSPELQAVLNVLRGARHCQDLLLICTKPHAQWRLAEKQPHGQPPPPPPPPGVQNPQAPAGHALPVRVGAGSRPAPP